MKLELKAIFDFQKHEMAIKRHYYVLFTLIIGTRTKIGKNGKKCVVNFLQLQLKNKYYLVNDSLYY